MTTALDKRPSAAPRPAAGAAAFAAVAAVTVLAGFFRALDLASHLVQTSDSAQGFVVGHAVAGGNLLLRGWRFPLNDYYFTDTIPYAALEGLFGSRPHLLAVEPALLYALFVVTAFLICVRRTVRMTQNLYSAAILALFLAGPVWIGTWNPLFLSDMHVGTAVGALLALVFAARLTNVTRARRRLTYAVLVVVVAAALVSSDPFSLVFAFAPAFVVLAWDSVHTRDAVSALVALCAGVALGLTLPLLVSGAGGFTTQNDVIGRLVGAPQAGRNFVALLAGLLRDFGIGTGFSAWSVGQQVLRSVALALAIVATAATCHKLKDTQSTPRLDRFLAAGIIALLAACAASAQFGKGIVPDRLWEGGPPMRYLVPVYLFSAVLAGRVVPGLLAKCPACLVNFARAALLICAAAAILFGGAVLFSATQPRWIADNAAAAAARWLEKEGLLQGVGEYWSANLIAALSGNRVQVRSVVADERRLVPYLWVDDARWYGRPPQFAIWEEPNKTGVSLAAVRATYSVCRTTYVAGYRIAVLARAPHPGGAPVCTSPAPPPQ